ncbi:MAG TPA: amidohydrolase family protein [Burkholderiales bacterium]|jgi:predicted TIM-barrel fold metal-dependent hydrolase|nr:amidohydrolase family protein [Burkholderiales bacterium]
MEHRAAEIHAALKHPVIDGDGHWMEPIPIFLEYLRELGGAESVDQMRAMWRRTDAWYRSSSQERQHNRMRRLIWWGVTSNTLDKATALLPALLNERLPELGIDFAIMYPSFGLTINAIAEDHLSRAAARAYNMMTAEMFAPFAARFAPVAIIPARTPEAAIEELEYAVRQLGFKAIMLRGNQERPIAGAAEGIDAQKANWYCDNIALDSPYDYDPFWQRCVDYGVAVTQHSGSTRWPDRASISNFTFNHVGHFAESNHAFARGVFLGGVARRFPSLNFGFMEGGVSWACQMYGDLIEHWEKRRRAGLQYPSETSVAELRHLIDRYGDQRLKNSTDAIMGSLDAFRPECSLEELARPEHVTDDFEAAGINSKEDVRGVFSNNFYFGCEADDRATMWAFDPRMGVRLRPVFSSDFTHFDVPDFREVIPEAFEMVERKFVTEQDFREFTFSNAARLHTRNNPDFFKGTVVERAVADELGVKKGVSLAEA